MTRLVLAVLMLFLVGSSIDCLCTGGDDDDREDDDDEEADDDTESGGPFPGGDDDDATDQNCSCFILCGSEDETPFQDCVDADLLQVTCENYATQRCADESQTVEKWVCSSSCDACSEDCAPSWY
ncbi:MAG: hypothetical protein M5R36_12385 [Deltaproteobacteria bacterium]|nr:hypothetical protein [Deltaproteobacteria bacterium]